MILEATLRLFPLPEREVVVRTEGVALPAALERARMLSNTAVRLLALRLEGASNKAHGWTISAVRAGAREVVDWELVTVSSLIVPSTDEMNGSASSATIGDQGPGDGLMIK